MGRKKRPVGIPPLVIKNFLFLNLLILVTLVFSAVGLHYFLRPKVLPTLAFSGGSGERPKAGVLVFWELETGRARRLLFEGIPILKHRFNP